MKNLTTFVLTAITLTLMAANAGTPSRSINDATFESLTQPVQTVGAATR